MPIDEAAVAFELPHVRAAATAGAPLADRISVRDYTRAVDIGAFSTERGHPQRVRFNVVLEVCHSAASADDDVDKVLSYDTITDAIEAELAHERINLLETLAERIARRCLADPRAVRAFVRVEKLDRVPGALGVEIARSRHDHLPRLRPVASAAPAGAPAPAVVFLPRAALAGPAGPGWRGALAALPVPAIAAIEPAQPQAPARSEAELRIGLLAIEQAAWALAAADARFLVAASRAEIAWALKERRPAVWAPTKLVVDALGRPAADASDPLGLAVWLAGELGARALVSVGVPGPAGTLSADPGDPAALAALIEKET